MAHFVQKKAFSLEKIILSVSEVGTYLSGVIFFVTLRRKPIFRHRNALNINVFKAPKNYRHLTPNF